MVRSRLSAMVVLLLSACAFAQAPSGYTYNTITVPQSILTQAHGINGVGWLAGQYTDANGTTHGFENIAGIFTTIDVPGAVLTQAQCINSTGGVVGSYLDNQGLSHGFVDLNGVITSLDVPGASRTQAYGLNDLGQVVGGFSDRTGQHGFVYNGITFTPLDMGTRNFTVATGVNNAGQIVGYFGANGGTTLGFLKTGTHITTIKTNDVVTEPLGIHSSGTIVGIEGTDTAFKSFMYQNGHFSPIPIKVPSSFLTQAEGINDTGQVVGWFLFEGSPLEGFTALP